MEIQKLYEWNPWWEDPRLIKEWSGKERPKYDDLLHSIDVREVTIIIGVRRSGKSTLMYQMIDFLLKKNIDPKQVLFVNFEDKKLTLDSLDDIYACYRQTLNSDQKAYIFFDEVHKKEGWEAWIRKKYDLKTNDKFIISGSCSHLLKKEYSTLLTGRNMTFEVFPLSFEEYLVFKDFEIMPENLKKRMVLEKKKHWIMKQLKEYIYFGGFPEVLLKEERYKTKLLEQYFDDILYKDIVDRYNVNSQKAKDLALFLITNMAQLLSLRNLRNSLDISYDTIKDYCSYYNEAFLFFALHHFSYSFKEQKTTASKIYCIDNGLRNAVSFRFSKDEGKLVENLVFLEIKRRRKDVYYWRNKGEVDFLLKNKDNTLTAINVSYTDAIDERERTALLEARQVFGKKIKECILVTKDMERKEQGIMFVPLWKWLLE